MGIWISWNWAHTADRAVFFFFISHETTTVCWFLIMFPYSSHCIWISKVVSMRWFNVFPAGFLQEFPLPFMFLCLQWQQTFCVKSLFLSWVCHFAYSRFKRTESCLGVMASNRHWSYDRSFMLTLTHRHIQRRRNPDTHPWNSNISYGTLH